MEAEVVHKRQVTVKMGIWKGAILRSQTAAIMMIAATCWELTILYNTFDFFFAFIDQLYQETFTNLTVYLNQWRNHQRYLQ